MRNRYLSRALILFITLTSCVKKSEVWRVPLIALPPKVSSELAHSNSVGYILRQTHEPLFRSGDNATIYSNLLTSWDRSKDSKSFQFCIKPGIEFSTGRPFTILELTSALEKLQKIRDNILIQPDGNCVSVISEKSIPRLFDILTSYEFAPEIKDPTSNSIIGLGPYYTSKLSEVEIELSRKVTSSAGFEKIQFLKLSDHLLEKFSKDEIQDYNRIPLEKIPVSVKVSYSSYPAPLLKTYGVLLNIEDPEVRKKLYNCLDLKRLRQTFFPTLNNPIKLATILPVGIEGAREGDVDQNCKPGVTLKKQKQLVLANWKHELQQGLKDFFGGEKGKLGFEIQVKNVEQNSLIASLYGKHDAYDLLVVAIDTDTEEYLPFFEPFLDEKKVIHKLKISDLKHYYRQLVEANSKSEAKYIALKLDYLLRKKAVFIPLVQDVRVFYFPKSLSNIILGNNFLGHIEVGKLEP